MNEQSVCLVHIFWNELKAKNGESERAKKGEREIEREGKRGREASQLQWPQIHDTASLRHQENWILCILCSFRGAYWYLVVLQQHESFKLNKMWMPTAKKLERICFAPFAALLFHSRFILLHAEEITSRLLFPSFLIVWISESSRAPFKQL